MTEQFILEFAPLRLKKQGYSKYHRRHRDFIIEAGTTVTIPAYNEMFFIIDEPPGLVVDSDYGSTIKRKILFLRAFIFIEVKSRLRIQEMQSEE